MERLYNVQSQILASVNDKFYRFLYSTIDWENRMIAIKGPRGAGKTTLILQHLKYHLKGAKPLYISLDHPYFYQRSLYDLAETFVQNEGTHLLIDEVHRYPQWSRELKSIYDSFPYLRIIFTSSSALDLFRGEADLSRRLATYQLPGLSFREYLNLVHAKSFESIPWTEISGNHQEIARNVIEQIKPLPLFNQYLKTGYLPFSSNLKEEEYLRRMTNILNTTLESDLTIIQGYSASNTVKIKKLLGVMSEIVPFTPNISSLAQKLVIGRDTVLNYLQNLQSARIINFLNTSKKGVASLQKPDKIYLENTNLSYALNENPEKGNLRETFVLNQLINSGSEVSLPSKGDFIYQGKYTLEIGGKDKTGSQIKGIPDSVILADDIELGFANKIPLWLAGFLY